MSEELVGTRKGDYEILGVLGVGGMGKVFKVRNVLSDRIEAMKVLLPNLADQKDLADRFLREIKVLASLNHPNIAALRTALTIDNQLVMIMEYLEGTTLSARVEQGAIPLRGALNYISQVLSALSYAHQRQVIHRDIKPSNMMLTPEGVIKLMDFGIARSGPDMGLTMTGTTMGSLSYMSPEQVKCAPVDTRSDLYSVGVSLYEMVTGQRPFQADSHFSILQAHLREVPKPPIEWKPDLPEGVSKIILKAMEKDPAQRFQSADAFLEAVQSAAAGLGEIGARTQALSVEQASPTTEAVRRKTPTVPLTQGQEWQDSPAASQAAQMPVAQLSDRGHRGLYIGLGALIVLLVLVAAGISAPHWLKTRAKEGASLPSKDATTKSADTNAVSPQAASPGPAANSPAAMRGGEATPTKDSSLTEPAQTAGMKSSLDANKVQNGAIPSTSVANPENVSGQSSAATGEQQPADRSERTQAGAPDAAQLEELEHQADQLSGREAAIVASLDSLQRQQNAQGLQLRGDIVAAQARLRTYLGKALAALQAQDLKSAKKYLALAEPEAEKIETFLGR
jgi:eukaryotic-like serine/threonine-protein kinase